MVKSPELTPLPQLPLKVIHSLTASAANLPVHPWSPSHRRNQSPSRNALSSLLHSLPSRTRKGI